MSPRLVPLLGLIAGVVVAGAVFVAVFAFFPDPPPPSSSPSPSPSAVASGPAATPSPVPSPSPSVDTGFMIGEAAPPLVVPGLGGATIDLAELRGSPVWVNFMATWCPPCRDELPLMTAYAAEHEEDGLVVLAIDVREDAALVQAFMDEVGVTFPVGLDGDGAAQAEWGALALPVHYWIDASGIIRDGALGSIGPDVMEAGLAAILPPTGAVR
jgi:cytochrome c biogenesis protein CcmG/thiol:disulfide interchange protein DsbE